MRLKTHRNPWRRGSLALRRAFTLIELLVVIAIISVLIALLLPAVQQVREAARKSECRNKLKQIGLALHQYHDVHAVFPLNTSFNQTLGPLSESRSWMQGVLPFLEQTALHDLLEPWHSIQTNRLYAELAMPAFVCPSDTHTGTMDHRADVPTDWVLAVTNYKASSGSNWPAGNFQRHETTGRFANSDDGLDEGNGFLYSATLGSLIASDFVWGDRHKSWHCHRFSVVIDGDHCKKTAVHMPRGLGANIFSDHFDADFH
jgi:prepilin-type N-terminal cleavage/methylation domain-containing protein